MKTTLYVANSRGHENHGWLDSYHTFSFANYFNPERIQFGALRVINDDIVAGGKGFGLHPHKNMEIISIPLYGNLEHQDNMGNAQTLKTGDIQVMSAGTGIQHSEFNPDPEKPVNFFQLWILPDKQNVTPRYEQKTFDLFNGKNKRTQILSPISENTENELGINQNAWMEIGSFDKNKIIEYQMHHTNNGLYAMVIEGEFLIGEQKLSRRDGIGVWETKAVTMTAITDNSRILLIEVPMNS